MATKRIIIVERLPTNGRRSARFIMRADVPVARQPFYANPSAVSLWPGTDNQDVLDLADIRAGKLVEDYGTYTDPTSAATQTQGQFLAGVVAVFNAYQAQVTATNKFSQTGSFYDGTSWTAAGA